MKGDLREECACGAWRWWNRWGMGGDVDVNENVCMCVRAQCVRVRVVCVRVWMSVDVDFFIKQIAEA